MPTGDDLDRGVGVLLDRVDVVERAVGARFPLYADTATGVWTTTARGAWAGGFWAGLLWLRAALRGGEGHTAAALRCTERLLPRRAGDSAVRGLLFWYGAGVGARIMPGAGAAEAAAAGGRALAAGFDRVHGVIPLGPGWDGDPRPRVGIDAVAATTALLCWTADAHPAEGWLRDLAARNARRHLGLLVTPGGQVLPGADLPARPPGDLAPGPRWARGHAWGMLAAAGAARRFGGEYVATAGRVADHWLAGAGVGVPPARWDSVGALPDTSSAAIAAAALWDASCLPLPGAPGYRAAAVAIAERLVERHLDERGVLADGCYDTPPGVATRHELVWGSFFLLAVLARITGRVELEPW